MDWWYMWNTHGESVSHLFLQCDIGREIWSLFFCLFVISWDMLISGLDLLSCWKRHFGKKWIAKIGRPSYNVQCGVYGEIGIIVTLMGRSYLWCCCNFYFWRNFMSRLRLLSHSPLRVSLSFWIILILDNTFLYI